MPEASYSPSSPNPAGNMIELDLDVQDFASDWSNCDSMSSYVSRMVCHNRTDSLLFANLYSSALNELLETAFRVHGRTGQLVCRFRRTGDVDRIEIDMPSDDGVLSFYQGAVDLARGPDAQTVYLDKLFSSDVPDMALSLLELSVDYGADLSLTRDDQAQRLCLAAELVLEEPKP